MSNHKNFVPFPTELISGPQAAAVRAEYKFLPSLAYIVLQGSLIPFTLVACGSTIMLSEKATERL
ncbi:hypothetical protein [Paenibacillus sp. MMO-177]|uniref:hypothetical protein n=1 Tax=Paenibacillus sp. MMO-177 TaxID=3081289 RepID=UPI0030161AC5